MPNRSYYESYMEFLGRRTADALEDPRPVLSSAETELYMDAVKARQLALLVRTLEGRREEQ